LANDQKNGKDFLFGVLFGGIIGALIALFFSPKSRYKLREDFNQQFCVAKEKTSKMTEDVYEKGTQFISLAKEKSTTASNLFNKVKEMSNHSEKALNVKEEDEKILENSYNEGQQFMEKS
jgi:gas vesicle protein